MAGGHKLDEPMGDEIDNTKYEEMIGVARWHAVRQVQRSDDLETLVLRYGVRLALGAKWKREIGRLGFGVRVRGRVLIGQGDDGLAVDMNGAREGIVYELEAGSDSVRVHDNLVLHAGACIDSHCVLYGPLEYHGLKVTEDMGIHHSGTVFRLDGEPTKYSELCIDAWIRKRLLHEEAVKSKVSESDSNDAEPKDSESN
jgi:hypothetical protein